jgi:hypothetical protein
MAHLHPSHLTVDFSAHDTPSEHLVYEKAAKELANRYHVFHDLVWYDPSLNDSKTTGQIDFVVVQPEYGYIAIEVKGGRCVYDADLRAWSSQDRHGGVAHITDPFDQARNASRVIRKLLSRMPALAGKDIPHAHAVIFPDCVLPKKDLRADVRSWQILDRDSLFDFESAVGNLFESAFAASDALPDTGKAILDGICTLYGNRSLEGQQLIVHQIRNVSNKLISLTDRQTDILKLFREHRRLLVRGYAGTGKTTLALHKAKMLAEDGLKVLLVCFNRPLGSYLQKECGQYQNITAGPFLELCLEWLRASGNPLEVTEDTEFWSEVLPTRVVDSLSAMPHDFDAIIVDEAQDFKDNYWIVLEMLLSDPSKGVFYIFADGGQNIYHGSAAYPLKEAPIHLIQNVRNTNQVFELMKRTCRLPQDAISSGVDGPEVEFLPYSSSQEMLLNIEEVLARLVPEQITPSDIVVLGTKSQKRTSLKYGDRIGPFRLTERRETNSDLLTMTVHRFKGLESRIVILCELDSDLKHNLEEILYIGLSRSTAMLYVMYDKSFTEDLGALGLVLESRNDD